FGSFSWDMHYAKSLWFVTALFSTEMLFFLTRYLLKADRLIIAAVVGYFVLGYLTHYLEFRLPWGFDVALMLVAFYALGFYVKQWNLMQYILLDSRYVRYGLGIILLLVSYYFSIGPYTFVLNQISNYPFMLLSSISGVFAMLLLIQHEWLAKNRFLEFLGRNSYLILAFHELFLYSSQKVITVLWHVEQINRHNVGMVVVFIVLMVVQLGFTAVVLKRIFPFLKR
ncbi:MAG TPA: hypothetical protein ENK65_00625, partial [Helicobacteraceae bacterium]|nr:hypothetical protein [Helicobacteraceae bacterium]